MTKQEYETVRARIMREIERRGLTHQQVADMIGVPRPNVTRWLTGVRRFREDSLDKLFRALSL